MPALDRVLQLEVFVNGRSTQLIAAFRQDADGGLSIAPDQLRNVGIVPAKEAMRPDGLIDIVRLSDVDFDYDEAGQAIYFTVGVDARAARVIDAHEPGEDSAPMVQNSIGAVMNYTLFASTGGDRIEDIWGYDGVSGWLEGRLFGPYGIVTTSYLARAPSDASHDSVRLDSTWSYSSTANMVTYRAGDFISGGLSWTRPVRLGGIQIQRNFGLRPDLVTMPLLDLSGSAAVPSTVDVYVNNARRLSQEVPEGPFQITNVPVVTGAGTARVVVRDALGRETVTTTPYFASSSLLAPGLWDFSAEAGFARRFFGVESNDYDSRFMTAGTVRHGLTNRLTLEGHIEGGGGLVSGGAGAVFGLGPYGVGSFSAAASHYDGRTGYQVTGGIQFALGEVHFGARTQRTFGDYNDIASVTFNPRHVSPADGDLISAAPPKAVDQFSVSIPLMFDPARLALSYTRMKTASGDRSQLFSASLHRLIHERVSLHATAFKDIEKKDTFGAFVGLSMSFGGDMRASTGLTSDSHGTTFTSEVAKSAGSAVGDYGWRIRDSEGARTNRAISGTYRASFGRLEGGVEHIDGRYRATGQLDGSVVVAGGSVFFANRIDDAFAIVDTGTPGVDVAYENRPVGRTDRRGKLLVPSLRSYEPNRLSIDPTNLPVGATVGGTREVTVPADRSGTVVRFDVDTRTLAALVTLRDPAGDFIETGATGRLAGEAEDFIVGYDGQAYVTGLGPRNRVIVELPDGGRCAAEFGFEARDGVQVAIPDVICRPIE